MGPEIPDRRRCLAARLGAVIPFFAFPPEVRRIMYTTNAIESVNSQVRKIIKACGHFPTDDAAAKLIWLALRNITAKWDRAARNWKEAMNQFAILNADSFIRPAGRDASQALPINHHTQKYG